MVKRRARAMGRIFGKRNRKLDGNGPATEAVSAAVPSSQSRSQAHLLGLSEGAVGQSPPNMGGRMVAGASFALVVGPVWQAVTRQQAEETLNRMGLRPCPTVSTGGDMGQPCFRIFFGGTSMLMGPASEACLAGMDPQDPRTSHIATNVPEDWRRAGHIWHFRPEGRRPMLDGSEFYKMMLLLLDMCGATHLFWGPAALWSDARMFRDAVAELLTSGMPPVLHQVAFRRAAAGRVRTRGLSYFAGQEIEAILPDAMDVQAAVRRLARLAMDAMLNGPYDRPSEIAGLEAGEHIRLLPQPAMGDEPALVLAEIVQA